MKNSYISRLTTKRLSLYLRCLLELESEGIKNISSREMAERFHLNSAQIRKDLAYFGEFGIRGVGYYVNELKDHLIRILGLNRKYKIIIVGAGNLGQALADYGGFNTKEFKIIGLFDISPEKIGRKSKEGVPIYHINDLPSVVKKENVGIAAMAVPSSAGQAVLNRIVESGIKAVLNFVPTRLNIPENIKVDSVDLKVQMEGLAFHLTSGWKKIKKPMRKKARKSDSSK